MKKQSQSGFTLVELAVVMIIIGLLIGGVLKGQELIINAQTASTVAQVKGMDAAVSTFRDMYNALPGDMLTPGARLNGCNAIGAACNVAGNGDGKLGPAGAFQAVNGAPAGEAVTFFVQLSAADLITGINPRGAPASWGSIYPAAKLGQSGFYAGSTQAVAANFPGTMSGAATPPPSGLYVNLTLTPAAAPAQAINPNQAQRIDTKIDDGVPNSGSVRAYGAATCTAAGAGAGSIIYNESNAARDCGLVLRIQG